MMNVAKKIISIGLIGILFVMQLLCADFSKAAFADETASLRAGIFPLEGYHNVDNNGLKSGYGYALLNQMEAVADIKFKHIGYDKSYEEMLSMLDNGEIDVITWAVKTPEMEERFDFSEKATDEGGFILTVNSTNKTIIAQNYRTYQGITIGVLKGYDDTSILSDFAKEKGFQYQTRAYDTIDALEQALKNNEIDVLMSYDFRKYTDEHLIEKFGACSYYAIVQKGDNETLTLVNQALDRMDKENPAWRSELRNQHYVYSGTEIYFTEEEQAYLAEIKESGKVFKVLVNPDRTPYSYLQDGEIVGIMPDLFGEIAKRIGIEYEFIVTNNRAEYAMQLESGNVDICIDLTESFLDASGHEFYTTESYLEAPFSWLRRANDLGDIQKAGRLIYTYNTPDRYAWNDSYHDIEYITYNTREECIEALRLGEIDGYCTYTYLAEAILYDNQRNDLVATIAITKNPFVIGTAQKYGPYLAEILNKSVLSVEEYTETNIIRKHTVMEQLPFSLMRLFYQYPFRFLVALTMIGMGVLLIVFQVRYRKNLERKIAEQEQRLTKSHQSMLDILSTAIEFRSSESGDHVHRIYGITKDILLELRHSSPKYDFTDAQIELMSSASVLHDIGKIAIPDHILNKPGKLTTLEYEVIKQHPIKGCEILEKVPDMDEENIYNYACDICRYHHERWDGNGYPDGLKGDAIPIWAQVVGIADVYDALTSPRVYKSAYSKEVALKMIENEESGVFNPEILEALKKVAVKYPEIESLALEKEASPAGRDVTTLLLEAFQKLLNNMDEMVFLKDIDLVYRAGSPAFAKMLGKNTMDEVICRKDAELIEDVELSQRYVSDDFSLMERGEDMIDYLEPLVSSDGSLRLARTSKYLLTDSSQRIMGVLGVSRDVTSEYLLQKHHQQELAYLFNLPSDAYLVVYIDITMWRLIDERHQSINGVGFPVHGNLDYFVERALESVADRRWPAYTFYQDFTKESLTERYAKGKYELIMEYRRELNDGSLRWVRDEIKFIVDPLNGHLCMVLVVKDIQGKKDAEQDLINRAERDMLTGLLNRASFRELFIETLAEHKEINARCAGFMIDMDDFKKINDTYGHQEGDKVLQKFAKVIQDCFRTSDLVGRLGGDEFAVIMKNSPSKKIVEEKAQMLLEALAQICDSSGTQYVTASIGISMFPDDGSSMMELYQKADKAMYQAKRNGKNCVVFAEELSDKEETE